VNTSYEAAVISALDAKLLPELTNNPPGPAWTLYGQASSSVSLFATPDPNVLAVGFDIAYAAVPADVPSQHPDHRVRVSGSGDYSPLTMGFTELDIQSITYSDPDDATAVRIVNAKVSPSSSTWVNYTFRHPLS
jgi:hypothetical protein